MLGLLGTARQWDVPIAAALFTRLRRRRIELACLNVGGGFPARYRAPLAPIGEFGAAILESVRRHFGSHWPARPATAPTSCTSARLGESLSSAHLIGMALTIAGIALLRAA